MTDAEILQSKIDRYFNRLEAEAIVRSNTPSRIGVRRYGLIEVLYDYAECKWYPECIWLS